MSLNPGANHVNILGLAPDAGVAANQSAGRQAPEHGHESNHDTTFCFVLHCRLICNCM